MRKATAQPTIPRTGNGHGAELFALDVQKKSVSFRFRVSLVIDSGVHTIWGTCLGTYMISRPTLGCSHWWEFVCTECHHDVITALRYVMSQLVTFSWRRIFNFLSFPCVSWGLMLLQRLRNFFWKIWGTIYILKLKYYVQTWRKTFEIKWHLSVVVWCS